VIEKKERAREPPWYARAMRIAVDVRLACALSCALLSAGCSSDGTDLECGPGTIEADGRCQPEGEGTGLECGEGTREEDGECVVDAEPAPRYELRASVTQVGADGLSLIPIVVIGANADGTPATDEVVLSIDRAGAGEFLFAEATLTGSGALSLFRPCDAAGRDDCLGPIEVRVALADDPGEPVASLDLELVEQTGVYTAAPCLAGGNAMFFDGNGYIRTGLLSVTLGAWGAESPLDDAVEIYLLASGQENGPRWLFEFRTTQLGRPLTTGVYEMAERAPFETAGHPGMEVGGIARVCNTLDGRFQVHELEREGNRVKSATISFEQHCEPDEPGPNVLYGCVHYEE
jgi:hypothetical protein